RVRRGGKARRHAGLTAQRDDTAGAHAPGARPPRGYSRLRPGTGRGGKGLPPAWTPPPLSGPVHHSPLPARRHPPPRRREPPALLRRAWLAGTIGLTLGAFVVTVALAPTGTQPPGRALQWLLFVGSSVHVAATAWFYSVPEVRAHALEHRQRYIVAPAVLV